jgi:hypothetical protein
MNTYELGGTSSSLYLRIGLSRKKHLPKTHQVFIRVVYYKPDVLKLLRKQKTNNRNTDNYPNKQVGE